MEVGLKRTTIARIAASLGSLCGVIGLLSAIIQKPMGLAPHGWGVGSILLVLIAIYVLVDGVVSFEKSRVSMGLKH